MVGLGGLWVVGCGVGCGVWRVDQGDGDAGDI